MQKKALLQKAFHIILALLLFLSSTGFVLNKHYCQNELKSVALFLKAKSCHKAKPMKACPMHATTSSHAPGQEEEKQSCCNDETEYLKLENEQIASSLALDAPDAQTNTFPSTPQFNDLSPSLDHKSLHYLNYKPPLIVCDLSLRFQTFLC